jgi:hypothetical protein
MISTPPEFEEPPLLDVHPPHHAANTWRDFFIHIATITVGLLIAIGLEQSVEALHHRHQRQELEGQLKAEAQRNLDLVHGNIVRLKGMRAWIDSAIIALNTAPVANGQIAKSALPQQKTPGGSSIWDPSRTVWAVAKASGTVALLPEDEAQVYARVDFEGEQLQTGEVEMTQAFAPLASSVKSWQGLPPDRIPYLTVAERDVLVHILADASTALNHMLDLEFSESGACRAVLNGARSVDEIFRYIRDEAKQFPTN